MDITDEDRSLVAAYHEAGHVVACEALGGSVRYSTIHDPSFEKHMETWMAMVVARKDSMPPMPSKAHTGYLDFTPPHCLDPKTGQRRPMTSQEVSLIGAAGKAAELISRGGKLTARSFIPYRSDGDCRQVFEAHADEKTSRTEMLDKALNDAADLLLNRWDEVDRIAIALLRQTTLSGSEIRDRLRGDTT